MLKIAVELSSPELAGVPGECGDDAVEALQANRVRAVQQLRRVLPAIVHA